MSDTLWHMRRGDSRVIESFAPELSESYRKRLIELDFRPGVTVSCVVSPRLGAPKLYQVASSVFSLERQIAGLVNTALESL